MQCRKCFLKGPTVLFLKTGRFIGNYTRSIDLSSDCQTQAWIRRCNCDCFRGEDIFHRHPTPRRTAKISCHKYMNKLGMNSDFVYRKKGCNCNHKWSLFDSSTKIKNSSTSCWIVEFSKTFVDLTNYYLNSKKACQIWRIFAKLSQSAEASKPGSMSQK